MEPPVTALRFFYKLCDYYDLPAMALVCKHWLNFLDENVRTNPDWKVTWWYCALDGSAYDNLRYFSGSQVKKLTLNNGSLAGSDNSGMLPRHTIVQAYREETVNDIPFLVWTDKIVEISPQIPYYGLIRVPETPKVWLKPLPFECINNTHSIVNRSGEYRFLPGNNPGRYDLWKFTFPKSKFSIFGLKCEPKRKIEQLKQAAKNQDFVEFDNLAHQWFVNGYQPSSVPMALAVEHLRMKVLHFMMENNYYADLDNLSYTTLSEMAKSLEREAANKNYELIELLFPHEIDAFRSISDKVLSAAASVGDMRIVKWFRKKCPGWWFRDQRKFVETAVNSYNFDMILYIMKHSPETIRTHGLLLASAQGNYPLAEYFLVSKLFDKNDIPEAIRRACGSNTDCDDLVSRLLKFCSKADYREFSYALDRACRKGHYKIVTVLLSDSRFTPSPASITQAALAGSVETVKLLLDLGIELSSRHDCPITAAVTSGKEELLKLLLAYLHKHHMTRNFYSPLSLAVQRNNTVAMNLIFDCQSFKTDLISTCDDLTAIDTMEGYRDQGNFLDDVMTHLLSSKQLKRRHDLFVRLFHVGCESGSLDCLKIIHGLIKDDPNNRSAFQKGFNKACYSGKLEVVKYLLATTTVRVNVHSSLPLEIATDGDQPQVVEFLLQDPSVNPTTNNNVCINRSYYWKPKIFAMLLSQPRVFYTWEASALLWKLRKILFYLTEFGAEIGLGSIVPRDVANHILNDLTRVYSNETDSRIKLSFEKGRIMFLDYTTPVLSLRRQ